jgi:hypothetical protein
MTDCFQTIQVPQNSFRVYQTASQILVEKLGKKAPRAIELIWFELSQRDPQMIADDALENLRLFEQVGRGNKHH